MDKHWLTEKKFYCKDTQETAIGYPAYLATRHWKEMRIKVAEGCDYTCERCCGVFRKNFDIHHNTYKRVGKEKMGDLSFLCDKCHCIITKAKRDKKDFNRNHHQKIMAILSTLSERQLEEVVEYLSNLPKPKAGYGKSLKSAPNNSPKG